MSPFCLTDPELEALLCGVEEARRMGLLRGLNPAGGIRVSGERLLAGEEILSLEGKAAALHEVWKTAQTLMEYLSGIASNTADIVDAAHRVNPDISVACTRKNFPGTKRASIKAVLCGGASPHRLGLSETLLIFAEHRAFLGQESPVKSIERLRHQWPERLIVVEVSSETEAATWQQAGGINSANAEKHARAGADILITSSPYFAPPRDVAVTLTTA